MRFFGKKTHFYNTNLQKNHAYNTKHTIYKRQNVETKKVEILKEGKKERKRNPNHAIERHKSVEDIQLIYFLCTQQQMSNL